MNPSSELSSIPGLTKTSEGVKFKYSLDLSVRLLPMIKGILPPALTSSRKVSDLRSNSVISFPSSSFISPLAG